MIHRNKISEIARKLVKSNNVNLRSLQIMHPHREWGIGLLIATLIFVGSGVWSAKNYLLYRNFSFNNDFKTETDPVVYRETLVKSALSIFADKKINFDELSNKDTKPIEVIAPNSTSTNIEVGIDKIAENATNTEDVYSDINYPENSESVPLLNNN